MLCLYLQGTAHTAPREIYAPSSPVKHTYLLAARCFLGARVTRVKRIALTPHTLRTCVFLQRSLARCARHHEEAGARAGKRHSNARTLLGAHLRAARRCTSRDNDTSSTRAHRDSTRTYRAHLPRRCTHHAPRAAAQANTRASAASRALMPRVRDAWKAKSSVHFFYAPHAGISLAKTACALAHRSRNNCCA